MPWQNYTGCNKKKRLAIDTTFNLCDLWLTDTSYKNKRILNEANGNNPVFFGPSMLHFTKELRAGTPKIKDLKSIALDMGAAIPNDIYGENEGTYYDYGLRYILRLWFRRRL